MYEWMDWLKYDEHICKVCTMKMINRKNLIELLVCVHAFMYGRVHTHIQMDDCDEGKIPIEFYLLSSLSKY